MENKDFDFSEKVVLITGSSRGIGAHIAREFIKRNANVVITGRSQDQVTETANECSKLVSNAQAFPFVVDITNQDSLRSLVNAVVEKFGRIDVLVNNAGDAKLTSIYDEKLLTTLNDMINLNLLSVVALTQLVVPHLEKTSGSIINISSTLSQFPSVNFMAYCIAKAAVDMFSKCIAFELGPKKIRVNFVSPSAVRTGVQDKLGFDSEAYFKKSAEINPLRRVATVDDVANAVLFLASEKASFTTGQNLVVDGGSILTLFG